MPIGNFGPMGSHVYRTQSWADHLDDHPAEKETVVEGFMWSRPRRDREEVEKRLLTILQYVLKDGDTTESFDDVERKVIEAVKSTKGQSIPLFIVGKINFPLFVEMVDMTG